MVYWVVVLTIWAFSIFLLTFGGTIIFNFFLGKVGINLFYIGALSFSLGLVLNFVVVNWPTGEAPSKKRLDEKTLKALKFMSKVAPIAPKSVGEGLKKIVEKHS